MIFRKSKFLKIFSVVISLLIIIFILLYFLVKLSFSFDVSPSEYPIIKKLFPVIRIVRKIPDILYFPYIFKQNNLIVYSLEISDKDFQFLNENLPPAYSDELILSEQFREYVPAKFKVDNK
ncbi:MAG: hypothetical protein ABIC36_02510 [bacterium]